MTTSSISISGAAMYLVCRAYRGCPGRSCAWQPASSRRPCCSRTTFYQVPPEAVGVVLRFGRYVRTAEPGLHLEAAVCRRGHQGAGATAVEAGVRLPYRRGWHPHRSTRKGNFNEESMMLTGDLNVAIVEWIVQYRVSDPYQYLFKVRNSGGDVPRDERGGDAPGSGRPHALRKCSPSDGRRSRPASRPNCRRWRSSTSSG